MDDATGWLLLRLAVVLHRTVSGRTAVERRQRQRNAALRAAHRRGVQVPELAAGLGLSEGWIRQVLGGRKPPETGAVENAA
ncbi:hypothetical protein ACFWH4_01170 [Streptomyces sp. NPDC127091]|uniref:hypothetical protein n=1 Tax=Streptomyces sp. NPDC127091 TaxID=3347134 RepID=UPI00365E47F5